MNSTEFINTHGLNPESIDVKAQSDQMTKHMLSAINGNIIDIPMIPTYLTIDGHIKKGEKAVVMDCGGTNFRCGLATYNGTEFEISDTFISRMPGVEKPATWDEFISFVVDNIVPIIDKADRIGLCFSFEVEVTPEIDGIVTVMDKEIHVSGCSGKLVGKSVVDELARRGFPGKKCIILNDTAAALLGNKAFSDKERYSGYMGMICGTGVNTTGSYNGMLYNTECGSYSLMPRGDIDLEVDRNSVFPGAKPMEKMCSGAYVGKIAKAALNLEGSIFGSQVDKMSQSDDEMQRDICRAILDRSARCMAADIIAMMKLTGCGLDKPFCVCAEGSLIEKSAYFLTYLNKALEANSGQFKAEVVIGHDTTLPGSAAAAILNC